MLVSVSRIGFSDVDFEILSELFYYLFGFLIKMEF